MLLTWIAERSDSKCLKRSFYSNKGKHVRFSIYQLHVGCKVTMQVDVGKDDWRQQRTSLDNLSVWEAETTAAKWLKEWVDKLNE